MDGITRDAISQALDRARRRRLEAVVAATAALQATEAALQRVCGEHVGHQFARIDLGGQPQPTACLVCGLPAERSTP